MLYNMQIGIYLGLPKKKESNIFWSFVGFLLDARQKEKIESLNFGEYFT